MPTRAIEGIFSTAVSSIRHLDVPESMKEPDEGVAPALVRGNLFGKMGMLDSIAAIPSAPGLARPSHKHILGLQIPDEVARQSNCGGSFKVLAMSQAQRQRNMPSKRNISGEVRSNTREDFMKYKDELRQSK